MQRNPMLVGFYLNRPKLHIFLVWYKKANLVPLCLVCLSYIYRLMSWNNFNHVFLSFGTSLLFLMPLCVYISFIITTNSLPVCCVVWFILLFPFEAAVSLHTRPSGSMSVLCSI